MKQLCLSIYTVHDLQSKYIDTMIGDENIKICRASVFKLLRRSQNSFLQNNTNTLVINTSSDFLVFETFRTSLEQNFAIFIRIRVNRRKVAESESDAASKSRLLSNHFPSSSIQHPDLHLKHLQ
jgi:hypothetical protein